MEQDQLIVMLLVFILLVPTRNLIKDSYRKEVEVCDFSMPCRVNWPVTGRCEVALGGENGGSEKVKILWDSAI